MPVEKKPPIEAPNKDVWDSSDWVVHVAERFLVNYVDQWHKYVSLVFFDTS